jgi:hypothetical protein
MHIAENLKKKKKRKKKDPITVIKHSQNNTLTAVKDSTQTTKESISNTFENKTMQKNCRCPIKDLKILS